MFPPVKKLSSVKKKTNTHWNVCFRQQPPPPVSHNASPREKHSHPENLLLLCALLTRDLLPIAKFVVGYSRAAEDAEASGGDVTEELYEIRKSFSARLRSETLQRQSENLQKDSKIRKLETILESQLHRETAKDQKIAELEEKIEAVVQSNQTQNQRQTAELHKGRATLLSKGDKGMIWFDFNFIIVLYEGLSISFEPGYLGLYFWAEKCCRPDLLTLVFSKNCMSSVCLFYEMQFIEVSW